MTSKTVELDIPATLDDQAQAMPAIMGFFSDLPGAGENGSWLYGVELIVSELLTNIVRHAYDGKGGIMRFEARADAEGVVMRFIDSGKSFDPSDVPEPDFENPEPGGRGLFIVRSYSRSMTYASENGRNVLTVEVALP